MVFASCVVIFCKTADVSNIAGGRRQKKEVRSQKKEEKEEENYQLAILCYKVTCIAFFLIFYHLKLMSSFPNRYSV
jgi:hypothetical protein